MDHSCSLSAPSPNLEQSELSLAGLTADAKPSSHSQTASKPASGPETPREKRGLRSSRVEMVKELCRNQQKWMHLGKKMRMTANEVNKECSDARFGKQKSEKWNESVKKRSLKVSPC